MTYTAEAFDACGNSLGDVTGSTAWSITPEAGGSWLANVYTSEKAGTWVVTGDWVSLTDDATLTVDLGGLASFTLTGYPSSTTAEQNFGSNDITVTAYDAYGNVKTDYIGQVYFTSTDLQAVLPYISEDKYTFTTGAGGDNGVHTFAGIGFTLKTTGFQTITVTDGTVFETSSPITVNPATVSITITSINPQYCRHGAIVTYAGSLADGAAGVQISVIATDHMGTIIFVDQLTSQTGGFFQGSFALNLGLEGQETLTVTAPGYTAATANFYADFTPPINAITAPADGSIIHGPMNAVNGVAIDPDLVDGHMGSQVGQVTVTIMRWSDGLFWTGSEWGAQTQLLATLTPSGWTFDTSAVTWTNGVTYTFTAIATDTAGNQADPSTAQATMQPSQVIMTVSYAVIGGGDMYEAPTLNYIHDCQVATYTLTPTPTPISVDEETVWSVTPNPLTGSGSTERWVANQTLTGSAAEISITFTYYHQFQLVMQSNPIAGGTTIPSEGNYWYDAATIVQIGATANLGFSFDGWTGSGDGGYTGSDIQVSVTMNAPIIETANFRTKQITLAASPAYHGAVLAWAGEANSWNLYWSLDPEMVGKVLLTSQLGDSTGYSTTSLPSATWNKTVYYQLVPVIAGVEYVSHAPIASALSEPMKIESVSVQVLVNNPSEVKVRLDYRSVLPALIDHGVVIGELLTATETPTPISIFYVSPIYLSGYNAPGFYMFDYSPTSNLPPGQYQVWFFIWNSLPSEGEYWEPYMVKVSVVFTIS